MSPTPDPSEITAPKDPAEYRPKPLMGVTFWAMIALMLLCVLAGVAVATVLPRMLAPKPAPGSTASRPAEPVLTVEPPAPSAAPAAPAPASLEPAAPSPDVARLSARVAILESQQGHAAQAAAAALAASAVVEAAQGTGPFADELSSLRAISPPSPELVALARLAGAGAPSRTALAASFPDYAARAASAARAPGDKAGLGDRIVYELSRVVSLRRVGDLSGDGVDAVLARAGRQVDDGDLDRALRMLDRLPPAARDAMAPWRGRAERRAEIDRNAAALRSRALQTLAGEIPGRDVIRAALVILFVGAVAVTALALTGDAGSANVTWLGWRADMTAAAGVVIVLFGALIATIFWQTLLWILAAPRRAERQRAESRRRQANETLTRGFLAAAAGDGSEARRLAQKATDLADETPGLVRVLAAQAAEAAGDVTAAQAAYTAMLGFPEMRLAGHKGLMQLALAQGERETALRHAQEAFSETRSARWAWRALLEARLAAAEWSAGLELVKNALDRKIVPPVTAERARAALLAALAAQLETSPEHKAPHSKAGAQALDSAVEAAKLQPGFAPGMVMAARLLAADGKVGRATATLENAWKTAPHPALWLAFRDLKTDETPRERGQRLMELAAQNPTHRESRILGVERALIAGDTSGARAAMTNLDAEPLTARIAGLRARVAFASGQPDEARLWLTQGMNAPQEADWSDLDPEGRAFAYQASDWARLVMTYAETGELIHPRHERQERTLSVLPELPIAYADKASFITADGHEPALYAVEEEVYGEDDSAAPEEEPATQRRRSGRGRLASDPRAAK